MPAKGIAAVPGLASLPEEDTYQFAWANVNDIDKNKIKKELNVNKMNFAIRGFSLKKAMRFALRVLGIMLDIFVFNVKSGSTT